MTIPAWAGKAEFVINPGGTGPSVTTLKNGSFLVVWSEDVSPTDTDIKAQVYDASGNKQGSVFSITAGIAGNQLDPAVTALETGGFAVTWTDSNTTSVRAAIYGAERAGDGTPKPPIKSFEVKVGNNDHANSSIAALPNGGFVISVTGSLQPNTSDPGTNRASSYAYDSAGNLTGTSEFLRPGFMRDTDVAILRTEGNVNFVTVAPILGNGAIPHRVVAEIGSPSGGIVKSINVATFSAADPPPAASVTTLDNGKFLVAWSQQNSIKAQVFTSDGSLEGSPVELYASTEPNIRIPRFVIETIGGGFALAFQQVSSDGTNSSIYLRTFDHAGGHPSELTKPYGNDAGIKSFPSLSTLKDGRFILSWRDGSELHGKIFDPRTGAVNFQGSDHGEEYHGTDVVTVGDTLDGGLGDDTLYGGKGDDLFMGETYGNGAPNGADQFHGGEGSGDKVAYWYARAGVKIYLSHQQDNAGIAAGDRFDGIEIIDGSTHADTIEGNDDANIFWGNGGDDSLAGGGNNDTLNGDLGNDTLHGGAGDDLLLGGDGSDVFIAAEGGRDTFEGGAGEDKVSYYFAGGVAIYLHGGQANRGAAAGAVFKSIEVIDGTYHADTIEGAADSDAFWGANGNDILKGHGGNDKLAGGEGQDTIDGGTGSDTVTLTGKRADYTATLNADGSVTLADKRSNGDGTDTISNVEIFQFTDSKLSLAGLVGDVGKILTGDVVAENSSAGVSIGSFLGSAKAGGPLRYELLTDAEGRFALDAATGVLKVADGVRLDFEQSASHTISVRVTDAGGASTTKTLTILVQDVLNERAFGSLGADRMHGGAGQDYFSGLAGSDWINAGLGNDRIDAGLDNDWIDAGLGNDTLIGGLGKDALAGGLGKDIFVFDTKANKAANLDQITDFVVADDTIWLDNAVFRKLGKKGSEAKPAKLDKTFLVIGDKAKDKDDYLIYSRKKGVLYYDADGAGKGKAVEIAILKKNLKMTNADFFVI